MLEGEIIFQGQAVVAMVSNWQSAKVNSLTIFLCGVIPLLLVIPRHQGRWPQAGALVSGGGAGERRLNRWKSENTAFPLTTERRALSTRQTQLIPQGSQKRDVSSGEMKF